MRITATKSLTKLYPFPNGLFWTLWGTIVQMLHKQIMCRGSEFLLWLRRSASRDGGNRGSNWTMYGPVTARAEELHLIERNTKTIVVDKPDEQDLIPMRT